MTSSPRELVVKVSSKSSILVLLLAIVAPTPRRPGTAHLRRVLVARRVIRYEESVTDDRLNCTDAVVETGSVRR